MSEARYTPCRDFPGYEVSPDGRVRSVASNWRGYGNRELRQQLNSFGYPSVRLTVGKGVRKRVRVHCLVAAAFLPPRPEGADQIRHLDGDKANNHVCNLAWGNASSNALDRVRHGTQYRPPWHDPEFRVSQTASIRAGVARKRNMGASRHAG